jgi:hypothetical protein
MRTVHKVRFNLDGYSGKFAVPIKPLACAIQDGIMCLWILVDDAIECNIDVIVTGTGHLVDPSWTYCGTIQEPPFVWHIWMPSSNFRNVL